MYLLPFDGLKRPAIFICVTIDVLFLILGYVPSRLCVWAS